MANVPAIPQSALNAITDANTRQVLRAISDGIAVRNGDVGNGDNAFLTMSKIKQDTGVANQITAALAPSIANGLATGNAPAMNALANALQSSIVQSPAWQDMFKQVQLIASPETVQGSFAYDLAQAAQATGSAIQDATTVTAGSNDVAVLANNGIYATIGSSVSAYTLEQSYRVNKDNSLASAINTIWASIGGNTALIQDNQLAAVNATGATATKWQQVQTAITDPVTNLPISSATLQQNLSTATDAVTGLNAKWSVSMNLSTPGKAYVAGVSLNSAVGVTGVTSSSFLVLADTFAVGSPGRPDIVPFAIDSATGLVSIRGDLVVKNSITASSMATGTITAQSGVIAQAAIGTLQIAGNSVTVPASVSGYGGGTFSGSGSYFWSQIAAGSLTVTYPVATKVSLLVTWQTSAPTGGGNTRVQIRMDGATVLDSADTAYAGLTSSHVASDVVTASAGTHSFTLWFTNDWPGGGTWSLCNWAVTILGVMR
jgi:hypothetical protein